MNHYDSIKDFMESAGQVVPPEPTQLDATTAELRARLLLEETLETIRALGVEIHLAELGQEHVPIEMEHLRLTSTVPCHTLAMVDGICDVVYVALGTLVSAGLPFDPFMDEVCENNLSKVRPVAKIVNGKVVKPDNYQPPRLSEILLNLYSLGKKQ